MCGLHYCHHHLWNKKTIIILLWFKTIVGTELLCKTSLFSFPLLLCLASLCTGALWKIQECPLVMHLPQSPPNMWWSVRELAWSPDLTECSPLIGWEQVAVYGGPAVDCLCDVWGRAPPSPNKAWEKPERHPAMLRLFGQRGKLVFGDSFLTKQLHLSQIRLPLCNASRVCYSGDVIADLVVPETSLFNAGVSEQVFSTYRQVGSRKQAEVGQVLRTCT